MLFSEASAPTRCANAVGRATTRQRLLVLAYHGVDDADRFADQMRTLVRSRRPVSLDDVGAAVAARRPLPRRSVLVTFDDGDRSVFDAGLPVLRSLRIPAALFVISDLLGTDQPFWWDEVDDLVAAGGSTSVVAPADGPATVRALKQVPDVDRRRAIDELRASASGPARRRRQLDVSELAELEAGGVAIGSHTASHPCLDRCAPGEVRRELVESKAAIEAGLGHPITAFAYPNGNVSPDVEQQVSDAGYDLAFGFDHRLSRNPVPDPLLVSRVRVDSTTVRSRFDLLVSGVHPALHHARGRA